MRIQLTKTVFLSSAFARTTSAFSISHVTTASSSLLSSSAAKTTLPSFSRHPTTTTTTTHRRMFGGMNSDDMPPITRIGKEAMMEILEDVEHGGREESGYVVIDVRGVDEISYTGKLSEDVETLPLPYIMQAGALNLEDEEFEENFGFAKPQPDETLVFTCKAGIRSMSACQMAAMAGYTNLINYDGGSDEWFS